MTDQPAPYRFTVDEYEHLGRVGFFSPDDRLELIDGEIIRMAPIGTRHGACVDKLNRLLSAVAASRAIVRVQGAVRLDHRSEPQPDIALLRPRIDFYATAQPGPGDMFLAIEVSDTTLRYDLVRKARLYARTGVPLLWVIDLDTDSVHVLTGPTDNGYADSNLVGAAADLVIDGLDVRFSVADILPVGP